MASDKTNLIAKGVNDLADYDPYSSENFNTHMDKAIRENGDNDVRYPTKAALDAATSMPAPKFAKGGCVTARGQQTLAKIRARHGSDV